MCWTTFGSDRSDLYSACLRGIYRCKMKAEWTPVHHERQKCSVQIAKNVVFLNFPFIHLPEHAFHNKHFVIYILLNCCKMYYFPNWTRVRQQVLFLLLKSPLRKYAFVFFSVGTSFSFHNPLHLMNCTGVFKKYKIRFRVPKLDLVPSPEVASAQASGVKKCYMWRYSGI